jgi:hypothetical protein
MREEIKKVLPGSGGNDRFRNGDLPEFSGRHGMACMKCIEGISYH